MKKLTAEEIVRLHLESDHIIEKAILESDFKTNNKEFDKRAKLHVLLAEDMVLADEVYTCLLDNDCVTTRTAAGILCLRLNIHVAEAESVLEKIAADRSIGILGFSAETALKIRRGEYPGKTL